MVDKKLLTVTIAGVLALGASSVLADHHEPEKCMGVVKAGKNDCGTSKHACAGHATVDKDPEEWIALPKGLCEKLVGGVVKQ